MKDIILPRKKDKNNNRFGFVVAMNNKEAGKILMDLKNKKFENQKLYMAFEKSKKDKGVKGEKVVHNCIKFRLKRNLQRN